jgi:hypothetical protein
MSLELEGKVFKVLEEITGQSSKGTWVKQDFVIETSSDYPKKICFTAWGDKSDKVKQLKEKVKVKVSFNADSREYDGKWYTNLQAWKIDILGASEKKVEKIEEDDGELPF